MLNYVNPVKYSEQITNAAQTGYKHNVMFLLTSFCYQSNC